MPEWVRCYHLLIVAAACAPCTAGELAFSEQGLAAGLDHFFQARGFWAYAGGGAVGDFDRDGWQDVFLPASQSPDRLFLNRHDGTFADASDSWQLAAVHTGVGVAVGDFNGDGWLDVFVTSIGPLDQEVPGHHKLYRNDGGRAFTDVALSAGVRFSSPDRAGGYGAAFGDYDLDGDLDLCVADYFGGVLYRNDGDGTFTDVTAASGLIDAAGEKRLDHGFAPRFADLDGDLYPELLYVADRAHSRYFRNNGDGTFTDWTSESGTGREEEGMGQTVGDFDGDGRLDWYVTSIDWPEKDWTGNKLYLNRGVHRYSEVAADAGVARGGLGWAALAVDFDHDGLVDLAAANGNELNEAITTRSYLWRNVGDARFVEVPSPVGFEHRKRARGMASVDYDNDGDQDVIIFANFSRPTLLRNDVRGAGANWLRVFLDTGGRSDLAPDGFGSKVIVRVGSRRQVRSIDGGDSYLSKSELSAHFGLGDAAVVDELRIEWTDGEVTTWHRVAVNQTLTVSARLVPFVRGDTDADGAVVLGDALVILQHLFDGAAPPPCVRSADANDDGELNVTDGVYLLRYLFGAGAAPPHPFPECAAGTRSSERLTCGDFQGCV